MTSIQHRLLIRITLSSCVEQKIGSMQLSDSRLRQLEADIREDVNHINGLSQLLEAFCKAVGETPKLRAMHSLRRLFLHFAQKGTIRKDSSTDGPGMENSDAHQKLCAWIWKLYLSFLQELLQCLAMSNCKIQIGALRTLMEFVASENLLYSESCAQHHEFGNETFLRLIRELLSLQNWDKEFESVVKGEYIGAYLDVQLYMLKNIALILSRQLEETHCEHDHTLVLNAYKLLGMVNIPDSEEEANSFLVNIIKCNSVSEVENESVMSESDNEEKDGELSPKIIKRKRSVDAQRNGHKAYSIGNHRAAFSSSWTALLRHAMPQELYISILTALPDEVMPYLVNPLVLSDFLTDSYNVGGTVSVLALNSLFILMQEYNFDYPDFYVKLYQMLDDPTLFTVQRRDRFFRLLEVFFSSSHLPAYLTAAFAKRLARLSLQADPGAISFIIPMVYNLILRHKECLQLIHRTSTRNLTAAEEAARRRKELSCPSQVDAAATKLLDSTNQVEANNGQDPYNFEEKDPKKCNALQSSIWELHSLKYHYNADVAMQAKIFEAKLQQQFIDLDPYHDISYHSIFEKQIKHKAKGRVHLAVRPCTSLFTGTDILSRAFVL